MRLTTYITHVAIVHFSPICKVFLAWKYLSLFTICLGKKNSFKDTFKISLVTILISSKRNLCPAPFSELRLVCLRREGSERSLRAIGVGGFPSRWYSTFRNLAVLKASEIRAVRHLTWKKLFQAFPVYRWIMWLIQKNAGWVTRKGDHSTILLDLLECEWGKTCRLWWVKFCKLN